MVCTSRDLRILDAETGRQKKVLVGLFKDESEQSEITGFQLVSHNKKFVASDHSGKIGLFEYNTGRLLKELKS